LISAQANRGRALEDLLERVFESAGPGVFMLRQHSRWVPWRGGAFPQKGAPLDFVGVVRGVPVGIECKETSQPRFPLTLSRFPPKEREALARFALAGGAAFRVVAFWREGLLAVYSWPKLEKVLGARRSLKAEDADFTWVAGEARDLPSRLVPLPRGLSGVESGENARPGGESNC
jgi:recombination protein U